MIRDLREFAASVAAAVLEWLLRTDEPAADYGTEDD